jgi:hypothetical protein
MINFNKLNNILIMFQCVECLYNSNIKCNFERHLLNKHKKADENINSLPNQCEKCKKNYSSKSNLTAHFKICKGIINKYECEYCKKELCNTSSKNRHQLICKNKDKQTTVINIIKITVFNSDPKKRIKFNTEHITSDVLINIFKKSLNNNKLLCSKLLDVIWENVSNRCIIKTNMKTHFSKVSGENGSWLSGLDLDIYPKFIKDGFKTSTRLIDKYRIELLKLISEDKIDKAYVFLDEMTIVEMDDKKMSKVDMDDSNYFYGNSEEESIRINGFREIDNERIDEFHRSYKRYRLKAYDNSKL